MFENRKYQNKAVDDIVRCIDNYKKPSLAVLPTAAGKSLIISQAIRAANDISTLVIQPSKELLKQNYAKFVKIGGKASIYSASAKSKEVGKITFATPGSIKDKARLFQHVKLVIIDEAHLGVGSLGMIDKFIKQLDNVKVIGLTATPIKLKTYRGFHQLNILTRMRPRFWADIIHVTQVKELYDGSYITPLRYSIFNTSVRNASRSGSDFDMTAVSTIIQKEGIMGLMTNLLNKSLARGKKKILIFMPSVKEAYQLQKAVPNIAVVASDTKDKEREEIVDNFVNGDLKVIVNYGVFLTGFDCPEIDLIICLRPTMSFAIWYQLIGRGIRKATGKTVCDVIDLSGNYETFGDIKDLTFEKHQDYGWGMFTKNILMTGIPLGSEKKKEDFDKIAFGKYDGTRFKDLPQYYLNFLINDFDLSTNYAKTNIVPHLKKLNLI